MKGEGKEKGRKKKIGRERERDPEEWKRCGHSKGGRAGEEKDKSRKGRETQRERHTEHMEKAHRKREEEKQMWISRCVSQTRKRTYRKSNMQRNTDIGIETRR